VWTYDLYQTYFSPGRNDHHYLRVAKLATIAGTALSIGSAYILLAFDNLMDYMQLIGAMFISPFFVIFFLGMLWKRVTPAGGFYGMVAGVLGCMTEYVLYRTGIIFYRTPMAATLNLAIWGGIAGLTTACVVSLFTKPRPEHELAGLVFSRGDEPEPHVSWFRTPAFLAAVVAACYLALNIIFR
jgi:SSS family solute:Na+ symporter